MKHPQKPDSVEATGHWSHVWTKSELLDCLWLTQLVNTSAALTSMAVDSEVEKNNTVFGFCFGFFIFFKLLIVYAIFVVGNHLGIGMNSGVIVF